jgi:hypothetical protein
MLIIHPLLNGSASCYRHPCGPVYAKKKPAGYQVYPADCSIRRFLDQNGRFWAPIRRLLRNLFGVCCAKPNVYRRLLHQIELSHPFSQADQIQKIFSHLSVVIRGAHHSRYAIVR